MESRRGSDEGTFEVFTLRERPDLAGQVHRLNEESWPPFLLHADLTHWESLFDEFADYQILFCEPADAVISVGLTIPFVWDDTTSDLPPTMAELMERAIDVRRNAITPNALSALAALVEASQLETRPERAALAGHALAGGRARYALPHRAGPPYPEKLVPAHALRTPRPMEETTARRSTPG